VQAQQCVQLTGTNRPTGLIRSGSRWVPHRPAEVDPKARSPDDGTTVSCARGRQRPGLHRPRPPPVGFAGLVVLARAKHPIPSRTRPLSAAAPMVLRPKTRESRSPPNLESPRPPRSLHRPGRPSPARTGRPNTAAGWSSPVARQAHNLKVVGSNPTPATKILRDLNTLCAPWWGIILPPIQANNRSTRRPKLRSGPKRAARKTHACRRVRAWTCRATYHHAAFRGHGWASSQRMSRR
jgi:hypothetical protein